MKKYRIVFPLLLSCILWYSCTDWLDYKPSDKQSEEQQFSSKDGFYAAVNGVYNRMSGNSLYGKYLSYDMIDILGQYYAVEQSDESDYYKYLRALTEWDYSNESVTGVLSSIWNEGCPCNAAFGYVAFVRADYGEKSGWTRYPLQ